MSWSKLGIACMHGLAKLPLPVLRGLGRVVGNVLYLVAAPRRKVALRNLELCFPEKTLAERKAIARESIVVFCQTFLDRSWLWFGSEALVRSRVQLTGAVHELDEALDHVVHIHQRHRRGRRAVGVRPPAVVGSVVSGCFFAGPVWQEAGKAT